MTMYGPVEVADQLGVYFEYTCPKCGYVCHKFSWEWPAESAEDPNVRTLAEYYADPSYKS